MISCTTQERAFVALEECDRLEFVVEGQSKTILKPSELVQDGGMFDAVIAVIQYFGLGETKLRIRITSGIPIRAGLSGSTAIMTALVACLLEWMELNSYDGRKKGFYSKTLNNLYLLAETVRHIELYFLKIVCGYQDAYMCAFGSLNFLDFRDKQNYLSLFREPLGTVENIAPNSPEIPLILAHTGVKRVSGTVHKPVRDRWIEGDNHITKSVLRLAFIARMSKIAIVSGDWELLGEAMTENHEIVRSFGSSSDINEKIIKIALDSGAIAAKLASAGKGGTIIALNPEPGPMLEALKDAGAARILYPKPEPGLRKENLFPDLKLS